MAVLPVIPPRLVGVAGLDSPQIASYSLLQGAAFREADFLTLATTGAISTPSPTGSMATVAGPAASAITIGTTAAAGAPAATYYVITTYTATSNESLPSAEYLINCAAGTVPTVNVASAGAPAAATNFAAYIGVYSGGEALQQATKTTTALGATFNAAYPLTNNTGANRAASNVSANIVGIALHDSAAIYAQGVGGSATAGGLGNLLGTWVNPPPLGGIDPQQCLVAKLTNNVPLEISLKQAYYPALIGAAVGLTLDTSGYFVADTTATAVAKIVNHPAGVTTDVGANGDTFARVQVLFTSGVI